jgi:hypothetical protein
VLVPPHERRLGRIHLGTGVGLEIGEVRDARDVGRHREVDLVVGTEPGDEPLGVAAHEIRHAGAAF